MVTPAGLRWSPNPLTERPPDPEVTLRSAQTQIAVNRQVLYKRVYGVGQADSRSAGWLPGLRGVNSRRVGEIVDPLLRVRLAAALRRLEADLKTLDDLRAAQLDGVLQALAVLRAEIVAALEHK